MKICDDIKRKLHNIFEEWRVLPRDKSNGVIVLRTHNGQESVSEHNARLLSLLHKQIPYSPLFLFSIAVSTIIHNSKKDIML